MPIYSIGKDSFRNYLILIECVKLKKLYPSDLYSCLPHRCQYLGGLQLDHLFFKGICDAVAPSAMHHLLFCVLLHFREAQE